jgi:hypothetical protein
MCPFLMKLLYFIFPSLHPLRTMWELYAELKRFIEMSPGTLEDRRWFARQIFEILLSQIIYIMERGKPMIFLGHFCELLLTFNLFLFRCSFCVFAIHALGEA